MSAPQGKLSMEQSPAKAYPDSGQPDTFLERLYETPHWYAVYTCAQREKLVASQFAIRGVEHFLPLYQDVRRWSDRRVKLQSPLFPGYLFVFIALRSRLTILTVPGVVSLVSAARQPIPLDPGTIQTLRDGINKIAVEPHAYLTVGQRVSIRGGPLRGLTGILLRRKSSPRVVISIQAIRHSFAAEVDASDVIPVGRVMPCGGLDRLTIAAG